MKCLIDGDVLAYTCLAAATTTEYILYEEDEEPIASVMSGIIDGKNGKQRAEEHAFRYGDRVVSIKKVSTEPPLSHVGHLINEILEKIQERYSGSTSQIYLSSDGPTWRHELYPDYKAQRPPRPRMLPEVREMLFSNYSAISLPGYEADDHITIDLQSLPQWVIVSKDKDFRQVAGRHYNPFKDEEILVGDVEAYLNLWTQVVMGDAVDNIKGVPGMGPKKTLKYIEQFDLDEIPEAVLQLYLDSGLTQEDFELNYRLVKLLDHEGEQNETLSLWG